MKRKDYPNPVLKVDQLLLLQDFRRLQLYVNQLETGGGGFS